jgi:hypothetical protein
MRKSIRRELLYLAACAAFGILALPAILYIVVTPLVERRVILLEVWPGSLQELYRGLYSSPLEEFKAGEFQFIFVMAFYCLFPYLVFQVFRWAFRGIRFLWLRQHRI